jgi:hypothetical protein
MIERRLWQLNRVTGSRNLFACPRNKEKVSRMGKRGGRTLPTVNRIFPLRYKVINSPEDVGERFRMMQFEAIGV